jgi:hypothetical protein
MLASDKHSSILRSLVNYSRKKFDYIWPWPKQTYIIYLMTTWGQCYKTFLVRDLRIFVVS